MEKTFYDPDGHCLPFSLIEELYLFLPYGTPLSCWIKINEETGCRLEETDDMQFSFIKDNELFWTLGKNQVGFRSELLSQELYDEIVYMRKHNRILGDNLLPCKTDTLRRYFNKFIMPKLSIAWHKTRPILKNNGFRKVITYERRYQLKGFRKNFQTILFYYYWKKYGDAAIAAEMVSKRMKHSSTKITIKSYIENVEQLGIRNIESVIAKRPFEWIKSAGQMKIFEYYSQPLAMADIGV